MVLLSSSPSECSQPIQSQSESVTHHGRCAVLSWRVLSFCLWLGWVPHLSGWGSSQFEDDANETRIPGFEERRTCRLPCDGIWSLISLAQKTGLHDATHRASTPACPVQRTRPMGICLVEQSICRLITSLLPSAVLSILTSSFFSYFVYRLIP